MLVPSLSAEMTITGISDRRSCWRMAVRTPNPSM